MATRDGDKLTSTILMCRAAIPRMVVTGSGSMVNISSIYGMRAMGELTYGPSKAALHQVSRKLGVLHGRQRIRVKTVAQAI
jgi:NAD(P)-dependent dehydrogenase (short-subunit alcohol dehydrogenase family)